MSKGSIIGESPIPVRGAVYGSLCVSKANDDRIVRSARPRTRKTDSPQVLFEVSISAIVEVVFVRGAEVSRTISEQIMFLFRCFVWGNSVILNLGIPEQRVHQVAAATITGPKESTGV